MADIQRQYDRARDKAHSEPETGAIQRIGRKVPAVIARYFFLSGGNIARYGCHCLVCLLFSLEILANS